MVSEIINKKEVKKQVGGGNFNLIVYNELKSGLNPARISEKYNISIPRISYYLRKLEALGLISKVGYGTWEVKNTSTKEVKKTSKVGNVGGALLPDRVRGHAFVFRLQLPKSFKGWSGREGVFKKEGIPFEDLVIGGVKRGQKLVFKGRKVHLFKSSIVIYEKASFLADTAKDSQAGAINDFISFVKSLESYLKASFTQGGKYKFKVSRQHYSLVKNALAKQYNESGEKLRVYAENGLWLIIDNSYNLDECETVHSKTSVSDNKKVQDFFNGLKEYDDFTPQFVVKTMVGIQENQQVFADNMKSHIQAIKDIGKAVNELKEVIKRLNK